MTCASCATDIPGSTRFCPQCGSPGTSTAVTTETRHIDLDAAERGHRVDPYPSEHPTRGESPTVMLSDGAVAAAAPQSATRSATPGTDRANPAARVARERLSGWAGRFGSAPVEVRLATVGAALTVLSFLLLPYSAGLGQAVELSGRLWWRPIAAVAAAVLLATTLRRPRSADRTAGEDVPRHTDALLAAVVVATAGLVEAGLLGLITGDVARPRAGFYGMLIGLLLVVIAAVRAARRRLR